MRPAVRRRASLALLAAAVLAAHLMLLHGMASDPIVRKPASAQPFVTRSVDTPPPVPAALSVATPPPPAQPPATPPRWLQAAAPSASRPRVRAASSPAPALVPEPAPAAPIAAAQPAPAVAVPTARRLHYEVTALARGLQVQGRSTLDWRHDGQSYEALLRITGTLLPTRTQRSSGRLTPEGLAPDRFSDKARSEQAAHFERDKGRVSFSSNRPAVELQRGAQDRLSVLLQLASLVAAAPQRYPPGTAIALQTAGTRDAETWVFSVEGEEKLALPGGAQRALKLQRRPRAEFDSTVELWLAPGLDYVPVRMRLTQPNGDWLEQQWSATDRF